MANYTIRLKPLQDYEHYTTTNQMEFKRNKINSRVLEDLKKRSSIGIIFYILLAFLVIYAGDCYSQHQTFSILFLIAVCGICAIRFFHTAIFSWLNHRNPKANMIVFYTAVIATSSIWGAGFAWFMVFPGGSDSKLAMIMCTVGLSSGGIVAFMPDRRLSIAYNGTIILPAAFLMIFYTINLPLTVMILLYFGYMAGITFRGNIEYWNALENEMKLQEKSEALKQASRIDALTGLYNRRYFNEIFESEWKRATREEWLFTIVIGDIDHFKAINDTYGHLAGDECLKEIANLFRTVFQRETDLVARYGGEEFVVLLPDTNAMNAYEMTERVRKLVEATTVEFKELLIKMTISFGIASLIPDYKDSKSNLLDVADNALYQAKVAGRNQIKMAE